MKFGRQVGQEAVSSQPFNPAAQSSAQVSLQRRCGLVFQASLTHEGALKGPEAAGSFPDSDATFTPARGGARSFPGTDGKVYYELCGTGLCHLNYNTCHICLVAQTVKHLPAMQETWFRFLGREDPLEKEMAIHSNTLAWKIPLMEEPDRLQSMGSQRVGHD